MSGPSDSTEANPYITPEVVDQGSQSGNQAAGDQTGGVIPYKNPMALIAYYLGLFSILPIIGLFLALPAFVLGIMGLRARKRNPAIKGSIHAWIGIIMGGIFSIVWGFSVVALIGAILSQNSR